QYDLGRCISGFRITDGIVGMFANTLVGNMIWTLRKAFKKNKSSIWRALEYEISKARSIRREVNISRLSSVTKNGEVIVVPGKVLGSGEMDHQLTVCALSISYMATKKITDVGGKVITLDELIDRYPQGSGVRIIG
ncbi:MAG: 50S ribosomal protein L18e, partial [Candidatus Nitrosopolaris sp.]